MPSFRSNNPSAWTLPPAEAESGTQDPSDITHTQPGLSYNIAPLGHQYNSRGLDTAIPSPRANQPMFGDSQIHMVLNSLGYNASTSASLGSCRARCESHLQGSLRGQPMSGDVNPMLSKQTIGHAPVTPFQHMLDSSWDNPQSPQPFEPVCPSPSSQLSHSLAHMTPQTPQCVSEAPVDLQCPQSSKGVVVVPRISAPYDVRYPSAKNLEVSTYLDCSSPHSPLIAGTPSPASRNQSYAFPLLSPASAVSPEVDQAQCWLLHHSLKQNDIHQTPPTSELNRTALRPQLIEQPLPKKITVRSNQLAPHVHSGLCTNAVEDGGLSDLREMTRLWLVSHITGYEEALKHIPLEELGKQVVMVSGSSLSPQTNSRSWNLVKIENIPYNLDDDMLFEFLGKGPGLVPEEQGGVHIIMDRTTGKTMDCFLEFPSVGTAERFVQKRYNNNRRCILGGRHISLEVVKQGELMRWLFPKAKGALWDDDGNLVIRAGVPKTPIEIISREELVMILGHARTPHRSPFSRKCLQRPYESLMSVVTKFPWKETTAYTLRQRDLIFQSAFESGELLKRQILRGKAGPNIDLKLLRRLCRTISFCPGFTYRQKLTFLDAMGITTSECFAILGDLGISHPLATQFQALTVRPGADYVAVEAIAGLVASGAAQQSQVQSQSERNTLYGTGGNNPGFPRGPGTKEMGAEASGGDVDLSMRAAAEIELGRVYAAIKATFDQDQNQGPIPG